MASIYEKYNCSSPGSHQPDQEYSDISGIGVVVAFITVGFMVVLLSFLDHFLYFGRVSSPSAAQNQVDRATVAPFQRALREICPSLLEERRLESRRLTTHFTRFVTPNGAFTLTLRQDLQFVITISEAQTYNGIAILVSGGIVLFNALLSEYHWEMAVLLAWSCHVTNVTAMTSFRSYLLDKPRKRYWMLSFMTFLAVMLVMATLPTGLWYGRRYNNSRPVHYAVCAVTPERLREVWHAITHPKSSDLNSDKLDRFLSMIVSLSIIIVTFLTRAVKMSVRASRLLSRIGPICETASIAMLKVFDSKTSRVRPTALQHYLVRGVQPSVLALLLSIELHRDFLASMLSELVFALASIGWVTRRADNLRYHRWTHGTQNQWTFGQILPVALLIYPFVSLAEKLLCLLMKTYTGVSPSAAESQNDTSTNHGEHRTSRIEIVQKSPIMLYLSEQSPFEQTWPWKSYVIYQYLYQVFLLAANLFVSMGDYTVEYLGRNLDAIFLLHPLTTYITILLHMQTELVFKLWYPEDWWKRRRKAAALHISACASVSVLFFGLNAWFNYQHFWLAWWTFGWHFPNLTGTMSIKFYLVNAVAWVSGYLIIYHFAALLVSLWATIRTHGGPGVEGAEGGEVALEDQC